MMKKGKEKKIQEVKKKTLGQDHKRCKHSR